MSFRRWFLPALALVATVLVVLFLTSALWGWPAPIRWPTPPSAASVESYELGWPSVVLTGLAMLCMAVPECIKAWRRQ